MRVNWSAIGQGVAAFVLAAGLGWVAKTAYDDHLLLGQVVRFLNERSAQQSAPAAVVVPSPNPSPSAAPKAAK